MNTSLRKRHGVVYTPQPIVDLILDNVLPQPYDELANAVICDPACGDGAFLTAIARRVLSRLNRSDALCTLSRMTGYDIDENAAAECKANLDGMLSDRYPGESIDWNVSVRDALDRPLFAKEYRRFTHVVGNPPYVRVQHLEQPGRDRLAHRWSMLRGATDLYIVFYELALDLLREGGKLGFITPSSWLRSKSGSLLRAHLIKSHKIKKIIDFGEHQIFPDVTTYTAITIVEKDGVTDSIPAETYDGMVVKGGGFVALDDADPSKAWWVARSGSDWERMQKIRRLGKPLGQIADIHVGIQTLADSVFILPQERTAFMQFEEWILRDIVKASVMKGGHDPVRRAVIFPYDDKGRLLPEERISAHAPNVYEWLLANKERLLGRDKGKFDPRRWYGFGRHVSIVSGFGDKILTSGMNLRPDFQRCPSPGSTFYSGYCIKPKSDSSFKLSELLDALNSDDMDFFIRNTSRPYQGGWMSYAKSFIEKFPVAVR